MARQARSALADARALEEQNARVSMHGSGRFIGAGGVPSMGLSQFVGGGNYESSSDDECEKCGCKCGGAMCGGVKAPAGTTYRLGLQRGGPRRYTGPAETAIVPFVPRAPVGPLTRYIAPRQLPPTPTTLATRTPGTVKRYSAAEAASRLAAARAARTPARAPAARAPARGSYGARVAALLAAGVPLALIGTMLADAARATGASPEDVGYYDDYVGAPDADGDGIPDDLDDDANGDGVLDNQPLAPPPRAGPSAPLPSNLLPSEVEFYLQSGNLPDRFYSGPRSRKGGRTLVAMQKSLGPSQRTDCRRGVERPAGQPISISDFLANLGKQPDNKLRGPPPPSKPIPRNVLTMPRRMFGSGRRAASAATGRRAERAAIVKKVMAEKGMKLIEASRYVKANNLY